MSQGREVQISRLVLDVLKPHQPTIIELGRALGKLNGVNQIDIVLREVDVNTETVKIIIEGEDINYKEVSEVITHFGAAIHSVDEVSLKRSG